MKKYLGRIAFAATVFLLVAIPAYTAHIYSTKAQRALESLLQRDGTILVTVADGGIGVQTLTDGGVLLGSGTGAVTAMAVLADSEIVVGDGTTDPVAESGATLRTSLGLGTADTPTFTGIDNTAVLFASLGTPGNGRILYCSDCTIANPCAGVGSGAIAKRLNGVWVCN